MLTKRIDTLIGVSFLSDRLVGEIRSNRKKHFVNLHELVKVGEEVLGHSQTIIRINSEPACAEIQKKNLCTEHLFHCNNGRKAHRRKTLCHFTSKGGLGMIKTNSHLATAHVVTK